MLIVFATKKNNHNDEGFSLIEVLISLMIVSILSGTILGISTRFRNIRELTVQSTDKNEVSALETYLRTIIGNAKLLPLVETGFSDPKYMVGNETSIKFVAEMKQGAFSKGLFDVAIYVDTQSSTLFQTLKFRRFKSSAEIDEIKIPIYEGAQNFKFYYAKIDKDQNTIMWTRKWNSSLSLPLSVRLIGEIKKGKRVYELDIVIPMNSRNALLTNT